MAETVEEFHPTLQFGFQLIEGQNVLHQLWITQTGRTEWRPVPMLELNKDRRPAIAGYLEEDEDENC